MGIDTIYKKDIRTEESRRNTMIAISLFLIVGSAIIVIFFYKLGLYLEKSSKETVRTANATRICKTFAISDPLKLISSKAITNESDATTIIFTYQIMENPDLVLSRIKKELIFNKWEQKAADKIEFKKRNQNILIESADNSQTVFNFHCRQSEFSFEIYD